MSRFKFSKSIALVAMLSITGGTTIFHSQGNDQKVIQSELLNSQIEKQGWTKSQLRDPTVVYQAALRLEASYEATVLAMEREKMFDGKSRDNLLNVKLGEIKAILLRKDIVVDAKIGDVWHLTEKDDGTSLHVGKSDLLLFEFEENPSTGYVWNFDEVAQPEFNVLSDSSKPHAVNVVGSPVTRRVILETDKLFYEKELEIKLQRPWDKEDYVQTFSLSLIGT